MTFDRSTHTSFVKEKLRRIGSTNVDSDYRLEISELPDNRMVTFREYWFEHCSMKREPGEDPGQSPLL